jgi:WYL domain
MPHSLPADTHREQSLSRHPLSDWDAILNEIGLASASLEREGELGFEPGTGLEDGKTSGDLGDVSSRQVVNNTAYRIFKLLQWLIQSPLNLKTLNERFCADPRIGKALSNDSIWLYINTLKALGCSIRRPSPKNGFCYELISHPFGLSLSESRREMLARAKAHAQKSFTHQEMLVLDRFFKKVIRHSTVAIPQAGIDELFRQTRSADIETCQEHIRRLEAGLPHETLFQLQYHSPVQGDEHFFFIPEMLYYEQGVMYVRGDRENNAGSSSLRVDRILALETIDNEALRTKIREGRSPRVEVQIRIFTPDPMAWTGLDLRPRHGVYDEMLMPCDVESVRESNDATGVSALSYIDTVLQVRDFFYLKQRLLACGYPFQVLSPAAFRDDVQATLHAMLRFYPAADSSMTLSTRNDGANHIESQWLNPAERNPIVATQRTKAFS